MENSISQKEFYRSVFDEIRDAVLLYDIDNVRLVGSNKRVFNLFGYPDIDALGANIPDCLSTAAPYTLDVYLKYAEKAIQNEPQFFQWKIKNREGNYFWVEVSMRRALLEGKDYLIVIMGDITRLKQINQDLLNSEARFRELAESLPEVVYELDLNANLTFCNNAAFDFFNCTREDFQRGINVLDYMAPEERERTKINIGRILRGEKMGGVEYTMLTKEGTRIPVILHARPIIKNGRPVGTRGVIFDISRLKENERKLQFLSFHDSLTGLYNRNFFEGKMHELDGAYRIGAIILCDVDGLKIINDTLGHQAGDERLVAAAKIIAGSFRKPDIVARIGGDEFAVLLTDVPASTAEKGMTRIKEAVEDYNQQLTGVKVPLSLSMGMACNTAPPICPWDLFKEADDNMYRQKLYHNQSTRSAIVQTLTKALEARDFVTEGHADRLRNLVSGLGKYLNLLDQKVTDLCLLAQFHDIGKVGIPDRILFKRGNFTFDEYSEMKRHCEIGFRIAQLSPDLAHISHWILMHHEWWNGQGYPLGVKGEKIPLECRILAIADAYDVMTNDRPHRKAMSPEAAIKQLREGAGTQFDPELVEKFVGLIPIVIREQAEPGQSKETDISTGEN